MIRYHSCYPWHTGKAYTHLMNDTDATMLPWVLEFNKFDLYTKDNRSACELLNEDDQQHHHPLSVEELWPYYQSLIDKYFPNPNLSW